MIWPRSCAAFSIMSMARRTPQQKPMSRASKISTPHLLPRSSHPLGSLLRPRRYAGVRPPIGLGQQRRDLLHDPLRALLGQLSREALAAGERERLTKGDTHPRPAEEDAGQAHSLRPAHTHGYDGHAAA